MRIWRKFIEEEKTDGERSSIEEEEIIAENNVKKKANINKLIMILCNMMKMKYNGNEK